MSPLQQRMLEDMQLLISATAMSSCIRTAHNLTMAPGRSGARYGSKFCTDSEVGCSLLHVSEK